MEATNSSETLVKIYQTVRCHVIVYFAIAGNEMVITRLPPASLLLAVGAVLCAAELTGEHVCHKRET
jgi:hypothetical protein